MKVPNASQLVKKKKKKTRLLSIVFNFLKASESNSDQSSFQNKPIV